jgi:hypothetical protein
VITFSNRLYRCTGGPKVRIASCRGRCIKPADVLWTQPERTPGGVSNVVLCCCPRFKPVKPNHHKKVNGHLTRWIRSGNAYWSLSLLLKNSHLRDPNQTQRRVSWGNIQAPGNGEIAFTLCWEGKEPGRWTEVWATQEYWFHEPNYRVALWEAISIMQGDTSATQDSEDNMSSSVPRRTGANEIRFTLGFTRSRRKPYGRIGDLVTSASVSVTVGWGTKVQEYCYCRGILVLLGSFCDIWLIAASDDLPHDPNKIFRRKTLSFASFGLPPVYITYLMFRKENITIRNSSQMLSFPIANKPLLANVTKGVEVSSGASGQRTRPQFKNSSRTFWDKWRGQSASSYRSFRGSVQWVLRFWWSERQIANSCCGGPRQPNRCGH